jgi:hypothetical protein
VVETSFILDLLISSGLEDESPVKTSSRKNKTKTTVYKESEVLPPVTALFATNQQVIQDRITHS